MQSGPVGHLLQTAAARSAASADCLPLPEQYPSMLLRQTYRSQLRSPDRKYRPKADIRIDTSGLGALIVVRFPGRRQRNGPSVYETQGGTWRRPPCLVQMFRA